MDPPEQGIRHGAAGVTRSARGGRRAALLALGLVLLLSAPSHAVAGLSVPTEAL